MINLRRIQVLNIEAIKIIAAITMLIDHIGAILFPSVLPLRIIGRISMPLFAFAISEGCRYTKNRIRHFLQMLLFAVACQTVYSIFTGDIHLNILVTFTLSIAVIYVFDFFKSSVLEMDKTTPEKLLATLILIVVVAAVYLFCHAFSVDYGFFGVMMPVSASIFDLKRVNVSNAVRLVDKVEIRVLSMAVGLALYNLDIALYGEYSFVHAFGFLAIPILLLYSGRKAKCSIKYFFYVFYPTHLLILELIAFLLF